jgi:hypothetical protein
VTRLLFLIRFRVFFIAEAFRIDIDVLRRRGLIRLADDIKGLAVWSVGYEAPMGPKDRWSRDEKASRCLITR